MVRLATRDTRLVVLGALGLVMTALLVFLVLRPGVPDIAPLLIGPGLFALSMPLLRREAVRAGDPGFFRVLQLGLAYKLLAAVGRYVVTYYVYSGADASGYFGAGVRLARSFRAGVFVTDLPSLTGTDFIRFFTGLTYTVLPTSLLAGFLVFAWIGFWGQVLFIRAYRVAIPAGRPRGYAYWILFLPSLVYWTSSIGKEAWMLLALGLAAYGAARALSGSTARGLLVAGVGLWMTGLVRPHLAAMLAIGFAAAALIRRPKESLRQLGVIDKAILVAAVAFLAVMFLGAAARFLGGADLSNWGSVVQELTEVAERADQGGSRFAPTVIDSPFDLPAGTVTVLFRPFPNEAHNAQAFVAALESGILLLFSVRRIPWLVAALKSARRRPYVILALVYVGLFVVAFSSFPNFGLLARERTQVLPFYLVLFTVPPMIGARTRAHPDDATAEPGETLPLETVHPSTGRVLDRRS
jgi:hypothetical protein